MSDTTTITAPHGRKLTLKDLPLVTFRLDCGHEGRERAIRTGDLIFCPACAHLSKVVKITEN